ncbi:MAG: hypothetical protein HGA96_05270 [Desulfobulbaceae bacterium]|nr:hypothetical protein [Desulfobulbaceae bacterium]
MTMTKLIQTGALLVVLASLTGCAKEQVLGNLYEGAQMQNRQAAPPSGNTPETTPSYDEYLRQRREVIQVPPTVVATP